LVVLFLTLLFRQWSQNKRLSVFLLGWFWTPLLATYLISQFFQPIFFDRYLLIAIPAAALLFASSRKKISTPFLAAALLILAVINFRYFFQPTKRPFRQLVEFVKQEASDLPLINYNAGAHHLFESKYYGLKAPIYTPQPLPYYTGTAIMEEGDTVTELPEATMIGLITSANPKEVVVPGFRTERVKTFDHLHFLWLRKY
jgi:hypothetical protein